jgi:hypothetical protein
MRIEIKVLNEKDEVVGEYYCDHAIMEPSHYITVALDPHPYAMDNASNTFTKVEGERLEIPFRTADTICEMDTICDGEGIGPDGPAYHELFAWIANRYPELKEKYRRLYVFGG